VCFTQVMTFESEKQRSRFAFGWLVREHLQLLPDELDRALPHDTQCMEHTLPCLYNTLLHNPFSQLVYDGSSRLEDKMVYIYVHELQRI